MVIVNFGLWCKIGESFINVCLIELYVNFEYKFNCFVIFKNSLGDMLLWIVFFYLIKFLILIIL